MSVERARPDAARRRVVNVRVPATLHRSLYAIGLLRGRGISELVAEALGPSSRPPCVMRPCGRGGLGADRLAAIVA